MNRSFKIVSFISGLAVIFLDQLSKYIIQAKIPAQGIFLVNGDILKGFFAPMINTHLAFGLNVPAVLSYALFIVVIVILIILAINYHKNNSGEFLAVIIIISAALSNLIDRIRLGGVYDFISLSFNNIYWPTFNFADTAITISVLYLLIKTTKNNSVARGIEKPL